MTETAYLATDLGDIEMHITDIGLKSLAFVEKIPTDHTPSEKCKPYVTQVEKYFAGELTRFTLPIDWSDVAPFHKDVLKMVMTIPYGKTRTYKQIAAVLGKLSAIRAVGQANGKNPIAIVIPCHRVLGSNGELTGYAYGLELKRLLLELENPKSYRHQIKMFGDVA